MACLKDVSRISESLIPFVLYNGQWLELAHWRQGLGKQHLVLFVIKQKFLFVVVVERFYLIQQDRKNRMRGMILDQLWNQLLRHWGDRLFVHRLDIFLQLNWLIGLLLAFFGQLQSLSELFRVLVFELDWQPADEFQQPVGQHSNVKLSWFLVVLYELNVGPNILSTLIDRGFAMRRRCVDVLICPLLRPEVIFPAVVVL